MEVILISDSAVKVMLSPQDLSAYAVTWEDLDEDNAACRRAFRKILSETKHKTGFDPFSGTLSVQVYPCRSGGCELYMTVLPMEKTLSEPEAKGEETEMCHVFVTEDLKTLLQLCRQLSLCGYRKESRAYADTASQRCFLWLQDEDRKTVGDRYPVLWEYGTRVGGTGAYSYLLEHCDCLCGQGAVKILGKLT